MLEREHPAPGRPEQVDPVEPQLRANRVDLFPEDGDRPFDVGRTVGCSTADLVVEDDRPLGAELLERREVVVRRPGPAVQGEQRHTPDSSSPGDAVPGAVATEVDEAFSRHVGNSQSKWRL